MDFAPLPGQIDNVKIGAEWSHTSIRILINIVGRTIYVDKSTIMPHGVTLPIQINDGKNVIAIKQMVNTSKSIVLHHASLFYSNQSNRFQLFAYYLKSNTYSKISLFIWQIPLFAEIQDCKINQEFRKFCYFLRPAYS